MYHATTPEAYRSIVKDQLIKTLGYDKLIYTSVDPVEALMFCYFNKALTRPEIQALYMFEIDGSLIDWAWAKEGADHSPLHFKAPVITLNQPILIQMIRNVTIHDLSEFNK